MRKKIFISFYFLFIMAIFQEATAKIFLKLSPEKKLKPQETQKVKGISHTQSNVLK